MADRQVQGGPVQDVGVGFEVGVGAHTDLEALALGPFGEGHLPVRPAG
jgi:hypothetical protein